MQDALRIDARRGSLQRLEASPGWFRDCDLPLAATWYGRGLPGCSDLGATCRRPVARPIRPAPAAGDAGRPAPCSRTTLVSGPHLGFVTAEWRRTLEPADGGRRPPETTPSTDVQAAR